LRVARVGHFRDISANSFAAMTVSEGHQTPTPPETNNVQVVAEAYAWIVSPGPRTCAPRHWRTLLAATDAA
jgi:hypothetical protein